MNLVDPKCDAGSRDLLGAVRGAAARSAIVAGLCLGAAALPAQAINIYVVSSGDAALDATVQALLASHGHTVTLGPRSSVFDGTASLANVDAVYLQGEVAAPGWPDMPEPGQAALRDWVISGGGGLVTSEPVLFGISEVGNFQTLREVFPGEPTGLRYPMQAVTFEQIAADAMLTAGLPAMFTVTARGTDVLPLLPPSDAVAYYQVQPGILTYSLVAGSAGAGAVVDIGIDLEGAQLADANVAQMLLNALTWAADAGTTPTGTDLSVSVRGSACAASGEFMTFAARVRNYGSDVSGPVTLTVDLPDSSVASLVSATPAPSVVTPTTLTFNLAPLAGAASFTDVSITLAALTDGTAELTATAATTSDIDPANDAGSISSSILATPANAYLEAADVPEVGGGQATGTGALTLIEGTLAGGEADMYRIRVDDWAAFSASTSDDPTLVTGCGGSPVDETALYLFDASGMGIAFNEDGGVGGRGSFDAGDPAYAGRSNGEVVWLAVAPFEYDPVTAGGDEIWLETPYDPTRLPDGPGAGSPVAGWSGQGRVYWNFGTYRVALTGVSADPPAGTDLSLAIDGAGCAAAGREVEYVASIGNIGADTSGSVTLTIDLPPDSVATFLSATPAPASVTPTALTFNLDPVAGGGASFTDVSIRLTAGVVGPCSLSGEVATALDFNPTNDADAATSQVIDVPSGVHLETADAPELGDTQATGNHRLTAVEGYLNGADADVYRIRVDDWAIFTAAVTDPEFVTGCAGASLLDTSLFLFDSTGAGIAFDEFDARGMELAPGNPVYASRADSEIVWLAVTSGDYDPQSAGGAMWLDDPNPDVGVPSGFAPDGPGAGGTLIGWTGPDAGPGTYRLELDGVSGPLPAAPGVDLLPTVTGQGCAPTGQTLTFTTRIWNYGADASGPTTLTMDLPPASVASFANATPAPTTIGAESLTFDLSPISGSGGFADVSVTLLAVGGGAADVTADVATSGDIDPSNNMAAVVAQVLAVPATEYLEVADASELAGGQATMPGPVTAIEGNIAYRGDVDMFKIRVDDWASFSASAAAAPLFINGCGAEPADDTALFLFDSNGRGIALNDDGVDSSQGVLAAGDPIYAGRSNGEVVWIAVSTRDRDPFTFARATIWTDGPVDETRAPDGPGAESPLATWIGAPFGAGAYRVELSGVSGLLPANPGTDLSVVLLEPGCTASGDQMTYAARIWNYGADASGPITFTLTLPDPALATFVSADPAPTSVTATTATFGLAPITGEGGFTDLSITLSADAAGTATLTGEASTTSDTYPANNSAIASTLIVPGSPQAYLESGDAPELDGGQTTGTGSLAAIEGYLPSGDADMFTIRVDDWAALSATTQPNPTYACGGGNVPNTALFLFDADGMGIAYNETGTTIRAIFGAGDPVYAGRTNGEVVWIAISARDFTARTPLSGGVPMWLDEPQQVTRSPDGPGGGGALESWDGTFFANARYRITLTGASAVGDCPADLDGSGGVDVFDLLAYLDLWFVADPGADIDGAPGVDVFDLLAYLDGWFAGC